MSTRPSKGSAVGAADAAADGGADAAADGGVDAAADGAADAAADGGAAFHLGNPEGSSSSNTNIGDGIDLI